MKTIVIWEIKFANDRLCAINVKKEKPAGSQEGWKVH